jgi:DNA-binding CsgD family transcriptional regulator
MPDSLEDLIYECAFVPELWSKALERLAGIADARGGGLYFPGPEGMRWMASDGLQELVADYIGGNWSARTKRRARICGLQMKGFVGDREIFSQEELEQDPIYREFLWPRGFGWAAAARLAIGRDKDVIIGLERDYARGPLERATLERLNELHSYLARASLIASRLRLERARLVSEALALMGMPALVVDFQGRVLAANELVEALPDFVRWLATDRIVLKDNRADTSLKDALRRLACGAEASKHSFSAHAQDGDDRMVVHVIPIRGMARDIFGDGAAMVVLAPLGARKAPPPIELIRSMFGLTPREARIAQGIAKGATLDEIAAEGSVTRNTVRTQLRAVLEKTGCSRQAEVAMLLNRLDRSAAD